MNSATLGSPSSSFLHRSPSGAQRRIRQRFAAAGDWPTPKPSLLTSSMSAATSSSSIIEQVEPTISDSSASYFGASSYTPQYSLNDAGGLGGGRITTQLGYRKLIESSDYQSLLDNLGRRSSTNIDDAAAATTTPLAEPTTSSNQTWSPPSPTQSASHDSSASSSLSERSSSITGGSRGASSTARKPLPMPRSSDAATLKPTITTANGIQLSSSAYTLPTSFAATPTSRSQQQQPPHHSCAGGGSVIGGDASLPRPRDIINAAFARLPSQSTPLCNAPTLSSPSKPMIQVHPLHVPTPRLIATKPQPPPVPEKPKCLQPQTPPSSITTTTTAMQLRALDLNKSSASLCSTSELDLNLAFAMDAESLGKLEARRIESLAILYEKVGGRWDDLKNLHNEKKKNHELFLQTCEIAEAGGLSIAPYNRFLKRFESVYEVQTRLVLNRQRLSKELERTGDTEFLLPLLRQNEAHAIDVERIVDELDATFRRLDAQLCTVLSADEHERWVFFVSTLYSLIAEETSIQFKVRYVTEQIKKLEEFSFKPLPSTTPNRSASSSFNGENKDESV